MSATIPEHALLSDLLKPTGYDCPEALAGKTFAEATSGGDVEVETNKVATIDVSQYTEPVAITPSEGKDAMAKATVTLSNIPSVADLEANKAATIDVSQYTEPVEITPTAGKDGMEKATITLTSIPSPTTMYCWVDDLDPHEAKAFCIIPNPKVGDKVFWTDADGVYSVADITAVTETTLTTNKGTVTRDSTEDIVMIN